MRRPITLALFVAMLMFGCRRPAEPRTTAPGTPVATPPIKKGQLATVADLIEKFKVDRKPPAVSSEDILQPYDDGRGIGDRIYKGDYVWVTGPIAKIESVGGKRTLFLRDRVKRSIVIRADFVPGDLPLLVPLKREDVVTVWGKIRGMPEKEVLLENGILLTDARKAEIEASLKK